MTTKKSPVDTSKTYFGTCQSCFNQQVTKGRVRVTLVLHGYKRPGWGSIHGECMGVGELPYELSCEATKRWKAACEQHMLYLRAELAKRVNDELDNYEVEIVDYDAPRNPRTYRHPRKTITLKRGESHVSSGWTFEKLRVGEVRTFERNIAELAGHITFLGKKIAEWKFAPEALQTRAEVEAAEKQAKVEAAACAKYLRHWKAAWKYVAVAVGMHKSGYAWLARSKALPENEVKAWMLANPFPTDKERLAARKGKR